MREDLTAGEPAAPRGFAAHRPHRHGAMAVICVALTLATVLLALRSAGLLGGPGISVLFTSPN